MQDTIIKVGVTRQDDYGNLWVTPADGSQEIKIGEKRAALFPLFQQGNTVSLHWETFKNKPYVKDAKQIVGEPAQPAKLPIPQREPFVSDPTRNASIEAQTAYGKIMDNWEKDIPESMKLAAARWGLSKLGVTNMPKIEDCLKDYFKEAPEKPSSESSGWQGKGTPPKGNEKPVVKESVQPAKQEVLNEVRERLTGIPAETGRPPMMPQSIKTGAELFAYVNKRGISLAQFTAITQAANPNDLKTEEQLIAAWHVLAPKMKVK